MSPVCDSVREANQQHDGAILEGEYFYMGKIAFDLSCGARNGRKAVVHVRMFA